MRFIITESQLSNLMTEDNHYNVLSHFFDRVLKDFVVENDGDYIEFVDKNIEIIFLELTY